MDVGEIAAPATGDENFLPQPLGTFEDGHSPSALARFDGTHQSGSAAAQNQSVVLRVRRYGSKMWLKEVRI